MRVIVKKGDLKVLDFGCGEQPFRKTIEKKIVFIILMILQQNSKSSVGFLKTGDIKNEYYDLILLSDVVEHCYDFQFLLKTIFKKLKKNGILVATTPFLYREHEQPYDYWRMTSFCIDETYSEFGTIISRKKIGNAADVARIVINEGIISKTLFARLLKFIILKLARFINSDSLFDFREYVFFIRSLCKKMKIYVANYISLIQHTGGISRFVKKLILDLKSRNSHGRYFFEEFIKNKVKDSHRSKVKSRILTAVFFVFRVFNVWCFKPDLIHDTYPTRLSLSFSTKKTLITVYDCIPEIFSDQFRKVIKQRRHFITRAFHIHAISNATKRDIIRIFGIPEKKSQ